MRKNRAGETAAYYIWELNGPDARAEQGPECRAPSSLGRKFSAFWGRRNASLVGRRAPAPGNALSFEERCGGGRDSAQNCCRSDYLSKQLRLAADLSAAPDAFSFPTSVLFADVEIANNTAGL